MERESEVFCPKCASRVDILDWFTDVPGEGFGYGNCPVCGGVDYKVRRGRVTEVSFPDPAEFAEYGEDLLSAEEYDRMCLELLLEQNLI